MSLSLFIDTNGKIKAGEFPEPVKYCHNTCRQDNMEGCSDPDMCLPWTDRLADYNYALQAALDNGVVCEDQEEGRKLIEKTYCEANRISPFDFIPTNNFLYPIPDYKMEVKTPNWIHPEKKLATLIKL